jgi:hypothetical protein
VAAKASQEFFNTIAEQETVGSINQNLHFWPVTSPESMLIGLRRMVVATMKYLVHILPAQSRKRILVNSHEAAF